MSVDEDFKTETRKRFDRLEDKVDRVLEFKWMWMGGVAAICFVISIAAHLLGK